MNKSNSLTESTQQNNSDFLLLENYLEMLAAERNSSYNTIYSYRLDLTAFIKFLNSKNTNLIETHQGDFYDYVDYLSKESLSARSLARKISSIKQFYKFLLVEKVIDYNPALHLEQPKQERLLPKSLSEDDIEQLMSKAKLNDTPDAIRNYCMLEMLYSTGLRVSELIKLKVADIQKNAIKNDEHLAIIINGKGNKERVVILNRTALEALEKYFAVRKYFLRGQNSEYLFASFTKQSRITHISRQRFHQILKELSVAANIDSSLVSPHKLRHSFASHMLQNGADLRSVQELLGHADISSTQIYTKVLTKQATDLVMNHHPLSSKND